MTILLLLGIFYTLKYVKEQILSRAILAAVCLGLAFLTRNDSLIFAALIFVFALSKTYKSKPARVIMGHVLGAVCLYGLFVAGQAIFQQMYYGELLPNTYVLKLTGMPLLSRLRDGMGFVRPFLLETVTILLVVFLDLISNFGDTKLLFGSLAFAALAYQIYVGGDPWNYWRIMSPTMPLLFVLFVQALFSIVSVLSRTTVYREYILRNPIFPRRLSVQIFVAALTFTGLLVVNARFIPEISLYSKPYQAAANEGNVNTAIALNQLTTENASVGVFWSGSIPYYTNRKAIDFLGKSDPYIARLPPDTSGAVGWSGMISVPGHNKYDLNYSVETLQPTYVQGFKWGKQDISDWGRSRYASIEYKGVTLLLLRNSLDVYWERLGMP